MEEESKWYVITTKARAEKKVSSGLTKLGITHFLPLQKQLRQWKDRKKWIEIPLMGTYVFVNITERHKNDVFLIPGVLKFLTINGKPSLLKEDEVDRVRKICNYEHEVRISDHNLNSGDEVEIMEGPLKGFKGRVIEKMNNTYMYIQIKNLGFTASFKVDRKVLKQAE